MTQEQTGRFKTETCPSTPACTLQMVTTATTMVLAMMIIFDDGDDKFVRGDYFVVVVVSEDITIDNM